jgi:signal transduction histidine kinase
LLELRPEALTEVGLDELLRQLADAFTGRARVPIEVRIDGDVSFAPEVQIGLYRIAQEALNNVAKHAGASQVMVNLQNVAGEALLSICDNGRGFDPTQLRPGRIGMSSMRERAGAIGAVLTVRSAVDEGTELIVRIPRPAADGAERRTQAGQATRDEVREEEVL